MDAPPLRVTLVDDHEIVRDGIKLLLADTEDVVVCAEASSAREAVAVAARALPDVIVMDVRLQDGSGIEDFQPAAMPLAVRGRHQEAR
jgi:DNA-binding NarL/FixJ family response regulator